MPINSIITVYGTENDDIIVGNHQRNFIYGGGGNDTLYGGSNRDILSGGAGDDILYGGTGNDQLVGGDGNDLLYGGNGNDTLYGERGTNSLYGGEGADTFLFQNSGADSQQNIMDFEAGVDTLEIRIDPTITGQELHDAMESRVTLTQGGATIDLTDLDDWFSFKSNVNVTNVFVADVTDVDDVPDAITLYGMSLEDYTNAYW